MALIAAVATGGTFDVECVIVLLAFYLFID